MYKIFYASSVKKDFKRLPKQIIEIIRFKHFPLLASNPYLGETLHGEFKSYFKYSFSFKGTEYRIIYEIFKDELRIFIIMVGSRENFYQRLKRRSRK